MARNDQDALKRRTRKMPRPMPENVRANYTVEDVRTGGLVSIDGENYLVEGRNRYEETWKGSTDTWYELELTRVSDGQQFFLEFERDDELELSLWTKKLKLRDVGLDKEMLKEFDEEEEGEFRHAGVKYDYEDSGEAVFFRGDGEEGEKYYFWDFEQQDEDGDKLIAVECWDGSEYEACTGRELDAEDDAVVVLNLGGGQ